MESNTYKLIFCPSIKHQCRARYLLIDPTIFILIACVHYCCYVMTWILIVSLLFHFILDLVFASTFSSTILVDINSFLVLNITNSKNWKENVMVVLSSMDLDLTLRLERPFALIDSSSSEDEGDLERWDRSNSMSPMIMKCSVRETFGGAMLDEKNAKMFLVEIENRFAKNEKAKTSNLLVSLVSMKYKGKKEHKRSIL